MCGRYTIRELRLLEAALGVLSSLDFEEFTEKVNQHGLYNVAPSHFCPVIRPNKDGKPTLGLARWGLIPSWVKGKPKMQPINAKSETAATSGMFRQAMERRRCLVPADGFYEWQGAKPPKQPYFIRMKDDKPFAFAGLWERWKPAEGAEPVDTFTILTTQPNDVLRPIHNRMPVILARSAYERWMDRNDKSVDVADLLKPFDAERMEAFKVSSKVNKPGNNDPSLVEPI
ncbi:MAG TPA: SOS response-associated peptidase [Tepidisphaeraceae bacterium]|jgi:putative SOS response-associated peptidase YedK|nr:SOS response-associated peptidase [Tepidisphaeraceae bacterium]